MGELSPRKLCESVSNAFKRQKDRLKNRLLMLREYTGRMYGGSGDDADQRAKPLNLIYQAVTTLVPNLVYASPQVSITSNFMAYRRYAEILGLASNHLCKEIKLHQSLRMAITAAIFTEGWVKTGIGVSGQTLELEGYTHNVGQPYADVVDSEDMVFDPTARRLEASYYIGNRVSVPKQFLYETGLIAPEKIERLRSRHDYREGGENQWLSHSRDSRNYVEENRGICEYVDLVECWIPSQQAIFTIPFDPDGAGTDFLRVVPYEGPETGPYHMLGFAYAPNNPLPIAPAGIWFDLHEMSNTIARKMKRQAERQKSVLAYQPAAWEDAKTIQESGDGETVPVEFIDKIKEVGFGGTPDSSYEYMAWAKQMFSEQAMSIDVLSGSGSDEPTLGQAQMVQGNISVRLSDMQNVVYEFTKDIIKDLTFFLHTDPLIQLPLVKRDRGVDVQVFYTPEMREGDFMDYMVNVEPYSMAHKDPNTRARRLMEFCGQVIPALASTAQMLGPAFNLENAIRIVGREMNIDNLEEIINSQDLHMIQDQQRMMIEMGMTPDTLGKAMTGGMPARPVDGQGPPPGPGGARPKQPNPRSAVRTQSPAAESRAMSQEPAAEIQRGGKYAMPRL